MQQPFRILIIEDDSDTRANLSDILGLDGHEPVCVGSIREAIQADDPNLFGLIITDRRLPEGMIEDSLAQLKSQFPRAEIIVITAFGDMQSTISALRHGVSDYVIKPIIPDIIRATVNRIAEKQRIESELAHEHRFTNEILATAEAIILVLDMEGRVVRFNPYFTQLTGWHVSELIGKDWFEYCIKESDRQDIKKVFKEVAQDLHTHGIVNDIVGVDGKSYEIRWSNTTLKETDGRVFAILAVGVDVSDLSEAQDRALRVERLAAIGQTMTALAHESRNALQRIRAASDSLQLEVSDNPSAMEDLYSIQRASSDLQCLLEELRTFAAPLQINPAAADLPLIWRRAWEDIAGLRQGRQVELNEIGNTPECSIEVDIVRMEQVFRNIFENALAACSDPVQITVELSSADSYCDIRIRDNGPGVSCEKKEKLFEPFYTTKPSGTGLGLSICQRIVEMHDGSIQVEPSSVGASFLIRLPNCVGRSQGVSMCENVAE